MAKKSRKRSSRIGILLGDGVCKNGSLPEDARRRAEKAFELLKDHKIKALILSGKGPCKKRGFTEAEVYKRYLLGKVAENKRLIIEKKSMDTIGNAVYSKNIFLERRLPKKIVVITSDYHMERALEIFRHIFGRSYSVMGIKSRSLSFQRTKLKRREWEHKEIDLLLLLEVPRGDHNKAERLIREFLPQYR